MLLCYRRMGGAGLREFTKILTIFVSEKMDVFLMVRRKKTTIFLDAKETTTVLDLKKMIEGITKKGPSDQQLYSKDDTGLTFER